MVINPHTTATPCASLLPHSSQKASSNGRADPGSDQDSVDLLPSRLPEIERSTHSASKLPERAREPMAFPKKIVVAVDEGEESMHALSWCLKNVVPDPNAGPKSQNTTLVLLHAKPPPVVYPSIDAAGYVFSADLMAAMDKYCADTADHVIQKAKKACIGVGGNVKIETRVASGDPRDVICEAVEREGADTLVMGSHGYGPFKRAFFGSVSSHCAQTVKCPVLIVKRPTSA